MCGYIDTNFELFRIVIRAKNMAGTCEDEFFSDSILQFLREPTGSKLEELMEGAEAFIAEIENEAQHQKEPRPIFKAATPGDLQKFKENLEQNTTKSTNTWVNHFEAWRRWRELPHKLEEIPKQDLNGTLERFFAEVRKSNGSEYELDSLAMHNASSIR